MFNKDKQTLIYTGERYSNTTTNSLSELCRAFDHFNRWKVYDFTVSDGWNRLVNEYKRNKKHPATRRDDKQYFIDCEFLQIAPNPLASPFQLLIVVKNKIQFLIDTLNDCIFIN